MGLVLWWANEQGLISAFSFSLLAMGWADGRSRYSGFADSYNNTKPKRIGCYIFELFKL